MLNSEMTYLYKYLPSKAARSVCDAGKIRLGTLYSYRKMENFGPGVSDRDEEKRTDWSKDPNVKSGAQMNPVERQAMLVGSGMVLHNNYVEVRVNSPDCYILSFSCVLDQEIAAGLSDQCSETYDSCIEIFDIHGLLDTISKKIAESAEFKGIHQCMYRSRRRRHDEPEVHAALLKEPSYSYQSEVRAIWSSVSGSPAPRFVEIENICQYCRLMPSDWNTESNNGIQSAAHTPRRG